MVNTRPDNAIVVGRTVYNTRKSPIVTLYEPSVGLFINIRPAHLHTCNHINTQLLSRHAKLKLIMRLCRTALNPRLSRHLYYICVTWHVAMSSERACAHQQQPTLWPHRPTLPSYHTCDRYIGLLHVKHRTRQK